MNNIILHENNKFAHVIFSINDIFYSVPIYCIVEILPFCQLQTPQKMPKHTIGLLDYNGLIINVIDLRELLGLEKREYSLKQKFLLIKTEEAIFAIIVDKIIDIKKIDNSILQVSPINIKSFIQSIYNDIDNTISVINIPTIEEEIKKNVFQQEENLNLPQLSEEDEKIAIARTKNIKEKKEIYSTIHFFDYSQYLIFSTNTTKYCIPINCIEKIINTQNIEITPIPNLPKHITGIINFRGKFLTLINFSNFIEENKNNDQNFNSKKILILNTADFEIAILVDKIFEITNINPEEISLNNEFGKSYPFLEKQIVKNNDIYFIIDVEKLLQNDKMYIND